jgi:hypothetical protein
VVRALEEDGAYEITLDSANNAPPGAIQCTFVNPYITSGTLKVTNKTSASTSERPDASKFALTCSDGALFAKQDTALATQLQNNNPALTLDVARSLVLQSLNFNTGFAGARGVNYSS